jgi:tRNA(Ile)-lysidine synthase TilS/MesJ
MFKLISFFSFMPLILFLFSTGQDSMCFLFFALLYGKNFPLFLMFLNHQMQLNATKMAFQSCRISFTYQETLVTSLLESTIEELTEEQLRSIRYNLQFQVARFYGIQYLSTGHTVSDFYETVLLEFALKQILLITPPTLQNKTLLFKQYATNPKKDNFQPVDPLNNYKKKRTKQFLIQTTLNEKHCLILSRPLKQLNRSTIKTIVQKTNLPIFLDSTNFTEGLTRNRIRRYLLPYLQEIANES